MQVEQEPAGAEKADPASAKEAEPEKLAAVEEKEISGEEKVKVAQIITVTGRVGFNDGLNGVYKCGSGLHCGKVYYQNVKSRYAIRWYEARNQWVFDWRGLQNDDTGSAAVTQKVAHPLLVTKVWRVFDGNKWVKDPKIKLEIVASAEGDKLTKEELEELVKQAQDASVTTKSDAALSKQIVHQGWVKKRGVFRQSWKKRYLVLYKNQAFTYYTDEECKNPKGSGSFRSLSKIVEKDKTLTAFTPDRTWIFEIEDDKERELWHNYIEFGGQKSKRVTHLFRSNGRLKKDLADKTSKIKELEKQVQKYERRFKKANSAKDVQKATTQSLEEENSNLKKQMEDLEILLVESNEKVLKAEGELAKQDTIKEEFETQMEELIESHKSELQGMKETVRLLEKTIEDFETNTKEEEKEIKEEEKKEPVETPKQPKKQTFAQQLAAADPTLTQSGAQLAEEEDAEEAQVNEPNNEALPSLSADKQRWINWFFTAVDADEKLTDFVTNQAEAQKIIYLLGKKVQTLETTKFSKEIGELRHRGNMVMEELAPVFKELGLKGGDINSKKGLIRVTRTLNILKSQIAQFRGRNNDLEGENKRLVNRLRSLCKKHNEEFEHKVKYNR